jgi:hypothetical protein
MNLKITPFEAIKVIDLLAKKGNAILESIKTYELLSALDRKIKMGKMKEKPGVIKTNVKGKPQEDSLKNSELKMYREKHVAWEDTTMKHLEIIYEDFIPTFQFKKIEGDYSLLNELQAREFKEFLLITTKFERQLNFLVQKYQELINGVRTPLIYIKEKSQISYYGRVIQIEPSSNMEALCRYMFSHPIGELKEYYDIYEYIYADGNGNEESLTKNWQRKIRNAYESINKLTEKNFGFPIFQSKNGKNLSLYCPF